MTLNYYDLPHCCVARIHKNASTSLARATVKTFYPLLIQNRPEILPMEWQAIAPQTTTPDKPVFMLVRDPVDRVLSAGAMLGIHDIDELIERLRAEEFASDVHFISQYEYIWSGQQTKPFRLTSQMQEFCAATKLPYPLPFMNKGEHAKPRATLKQKVAIQEYYRDDYQMIKAIDKRF